MVHFLMAEAQSEPVLIICQSRLAVPVEIEVKNFLLSICVFVVFIFILFSGPHCLLLKHGILTRTRPHYLNLQPD